jgi:putative flavoprotein involved in K+ transport
VHRIDTLIIGAGQAGLALSRLLSRSGHDHVVLERGRVGERWRSERWDSLALLTPNWANRLPGDGEPADPDGFLSGPAFVEHLERYERSFGAPVRERTSVTGVEPAPGGFRVDTDRGAWSAGNVVLATGDCAVPVVPWFAPGAPAGIEQLHASRYRAPQALAAGGVLVVGSGASGHQIAYELGRAGREVVLAVGRHARVPRHYRGRDVWWWMRALGDLARTRDELPHDPLARPSPALPLDGRDGGRTLDLGVLAQAGARITGRLAGFAGAHAHFAADLPATMAAAEERLGGLLARVDEHIAARPDAGRFPAPDRLAPISLPEPPAAIDLAAAGIGTIVWATGFRPHHPWLRVPGAAAPDGRIVHERGCTPVGGLFVLGTRWQHRLTSHQIGGVGADAAFLAARIAGERAVVTPLARAA